MNGVGHHAEAAIDPETDVFPLIVRYVNPADVTCVASSMHGGGGGGGDGSGGGQAGALVLMGPNMGGKSCYARQVGLIVLLAQLGSYVPADACALTPMRALFTRMGAADQLCRGRSTFQNELAEAAEALQNLGPRTLLLLDELGRGTSTHDGATISASTPPPPPIPAPIPHPHPNPSLSPSPNPNSNPNPDQARP